ncbi:MAG: PDZ domain-containing protein, partial [Phycisphaerales bacterium]
MQLLNHHSKNAMLAVLIAATGLPASGALAQFRAEYGETKAAAEARQSEGDKDTRRTITITSDDKEHKYEVRIVNGEIKLAKLDGKELGPERVRITADAVVFLGEDGKKLHEFSLPAVPPSPAAPDAPQMRSGPAVIEMRDDQGRTLVTRGEVRLNQPKVMLGVNMSEPSAALRKQLRLDEGMEVILIERVIEGLPADKAGLEEFDVIVSIDGSEGASTGMLSSTLAGKSPDDRLEMVVLRGGEKVRLTATLAAYDPKKLGGSSGSAPTPEGIEREL